MYFQPEKTLLLLNLFFSKRFRQPAVVVWLQAAAPA
jgi:hypothetical protein